MLFRKGEAMPKHGRGRAYLLFLFLAIVTCDTASAFTPGSVRVAVTNFYSAAPVAGATVLMNPGGYSAVTDGSGVALFTDITPYRNYSVTITAPGYAEDKFGTGRTGFIWVETGATAQVAMPIKKEVTVSGTVTDSGGAPVAGAMVALVEERLGAKETVAATHTGGTGEYLLRASEGSYSIRAVADSYYQVSRDLPLKAGESALEDFVIKKGFTTLRFKISPTKTIYGNSVTLDPSNLILKYLNSVYVALVEKPEGAELIKSSQTSFIPTLPGDYTFAMMIVDGKGVGREVIDTITMTNAVPVAFPSLIPGPSELPLLYNGAALAETNGLNAVKPGVKVYLRGWGEDSNMPSPENYNPKAYSHETASPLFDIYGNKNGNWSQSAFGFSWTLADGNGADRSDLLADPAAENTSFTVPADAQAGDTFTASLVVTGDAGSSSAPAGVTVYVATEIGSEACARCHSSTYASYAKTKHAAQGVGCEACHGPGSLHRGDPERISLSHWPGLCGTCHPQFAQWQKSRHSDPLAFGHAEVAGPLLANCYKCHYTQGFIGAAGHKNFDSFKYPMFGTKVPSDTPNVGCDVCHDPHVKTAANPYGTRKESAELCVTCHEKKWQNATYSGTADAIGNGYHWGDYSEFQGTGNHHHNDKGCVMCHMAGDVTDSDSLGVPLVGHHTGRMRDVGPDGDPGTADDVLNVKVCQGCHPGLDTFDRNGVQTALKAKLKLLEQKLKAANSGFMPPFQPGKCATCHRGSNLPFIEETSDEVLKHAYANFSLVLNDRSFGIHNPDYLKRLLDDSLAAMDHFSQVSLASFTTEPGLFHVALSWTTGHENSLQGFNVYRSLRKDKKFIKINADLIPAAGQGGAGSFYEYVDKTAISGITYYYKIQDVTMDGAATMHNAVAARPGLLALLARPAASAAAGPEKTCAFK